MKNLFYLFLTMVIVLAWSCSDDEVPTTEMSTADFCLEDNAEYYHDGTFFQTTYSPEGSEFLNTDGVACGIAATIDLNLNLLILHIVGDGQHINIRVDVTTINEEIDFDFIMYANNDSTFESLVPDAENYMLIEEINSSENKIKGEFNFKIENLAGESISMTNGKFNCSYHSF